MKAILLGSLVLFTSCGSAPLAPADQRVVKFEKPVKGKKSDIYNSNMIVYAKKFGNVDSAIKHKDKDAGTIVAKGNVACNVFNQTGDITEKRLSFNVTTKASDNLLKITFDDLVMVGDNGNPIGWGYLQMTDSKQVERAKPCLETIVSELVAGID